MCFLLNTLSLYGEKIKKIDLKNVILCCRLCHFSRALCISHYCRLKRDTAKCIRPILSYSTEFPLQKLLCPPPQHKRTAFRSAVVGALDCNAEGSQTLLRTYMSFNTSKRCEIFSRAPSFYFYDKTSICQESKPGTRQQRKRALGQLALRSEETPYRTRTFNTRVVRFLCRSVCRPGPPLQRLRAWLHVIFESLNTADTTVVKNVHFIISSIEHEKHAFPKLRTIYKNTRSQYVSEYTGWNTRMTKLYTNACARTHHTRSAPLCNFSGSTRISSCTRRS